MCARALLRRQPEQVQGGARIRGWHPGASGRARAHEDAVGQPAGRSLPDSANPLPAPSAAPGRGHAVGFVWAGEAVWEDSFIDGSSFVFTCETYHYYFLSEILAHGSRIY